MSVRTRPNVHAFGLEQLLGHLSPVNCFDLKPPWVRPLVLVAGQGARLLVPVLYGVVQVVKEPRRLAWVDYINRWVG
jgi:hypothetical protein